MHQHYKTVLFKSKEDHRNGKKKKQMGVLKWQNFHFWVTYSFNPAIS